MITNNDNNKKLDKNSKIYMIQYKNNYIKKLKDINNNIFNKINYNDYELNDLSYKEALKVDKRTYFQYYLSLLRIKHIIIFTFYTSNDYNSKLIKIIYFLFSFALNYTINALFINDEVMKDIYFGGCKYNFVYHLPKILYSTIIS